MGRALALRASRSDIATVLATDRARALWLQGGEVDGGSGEEQAGHAQGEEGAEEGGGELHCPGRLRSQGEEAGEDNYAFLLRHRQRLGMCGALIVFVWLQVRQAEEEEKRAREDLKRQRAEEKEKSEFAPTGVAQELGADDEIAKLMGFGSFA